MRVAVACDDPTGRQKASRLHTDRVTEHSDPRYQRLPRPTGPRPALPGRALAGGSGPRPRPRLPPGGSRIGVIRLPRLAAGAGAPGT